jgi:hypothetical protein
LAKGWGPSRTLFADWTRTSAESLTSFSLVLSLDASLSATRNAIYDTTLAKASLRVLERRRLGTLSELYTILDKYEVALIG